jgi:hypothetical protein
VAVLLKWDKHFLGMASVLKLWVKESSTDRLHTGCVGAGWPCLLGGAAGEGVPSDSDLSVCTQMTIRVEVSGSLCWATEVCDDLQRLFFRGLIVLRGRLRSCSASCRPHSPLSLRLLLATALPLAYVNKAIGSAPSRSRPTIS